MWTKSKCATAKEIVKKALVDAGYDCDLGAGSYSDETLSFTVKVFEDRLSAKAEVWNDRCADFGLPRSTFLKFFENDKGDRFQVVELRPRAPKYPVIATRSDGKQYKFSAAYVNARVFGSTPKDVTPSTGLWPVIEN